jgi:hypothetical protein
MLRYASKVPEICHLFELGPQMGRIESPEYNPQKTANTICRLAKYTSFADIGETTHM